jgi:hypothetical protein
MEVEGARSATTEAEACQLEDLEEDDVLETKKNKKRPDRTKMPKDKIKK